MWVEVDQKIFDQIKNKVLQAKKINYKLDQQGAVKLIFFNKGSKLIANIENGEILIKR